MIALNRSKHASWLVAGILLITILSYIPVFNNGFTNWDDPEQVIQNKDIQELSLSNSVTIFRSFYIGMYQPLTSQLFALVYALFGSSAFGFHLVSLMLHLLNVLLVFKLIKLFSGKDEPALITASLFALNPLQTESVAWISATSNLLYSVFFLAGIIFYLLYVRKGKMKYYWATLALFIFSLLAKPSAVTFPVIIVFADHYFRRKFSSKVLLEKIPFFAMAAVIGFLILFAREEAGHILDMSERFGFGERILLIIYAFSFYVAGLFVPTGMSAFHPYPADGLTAAFYLAPLIPLGLIFLIVRLKGEPGRQVRTGILFFLITIAIVLEFIPVGAQVVKERYIYLPSIGMYYAFAVLLLFFTDGRKIGKWIKIGLLTVMIGFFSISTYSRALTWYDSMSLWNDVLEEYPDASAALINRGNSWQELLSYNKAISDYSMAIQFEPGAADAYMNRGLAYYRNEELGNAIRDFDKAIELGLEDAETYNLRGLLKASVNDIPGALQDFIAATKINHEYSDAWINLGLMHANNNDLSLALTSFTNALRSDPSSSKAYYWRGMVQLRMGTRDNACRDFRSAISYGWPESEIPQICK